MDQLLAATALSMQLYGGDWTNHLEETAFLTPVLLTSVPN